MESILNIGDFKRGIHVSFEWGSGTTGDFARENHIRALGRVVTCEDFPQMTSTAVGVQLLDDPLWMIDPAYAISKGKTFFLANIPLEA